MNMQSGDIRVLLSIIIGIKTRSKRKVFYPYLYIKSMDFSCVDECSKCCIQREYYPSVKFGKVGVLLLPEEKKLMESLAVKYGISITIFPRIGISYDDSKEPAAILAYQLMGRDPNGNTCPFLDTESKEKSPHGGYKCKIYPNRPIACKAYPVIDLSPISLDPKCEFCENCGTPSGNINSEIESLITIKRKTTTKAPFVWRFATNVGEIEDKSIMKSGWFLV